MSVGPGPALGSHRCAHTCAGDTLTARSQDAPPEGDSKRVIHSLPNVNAQPSQLRRMALTPEESASIAAHRGASRPEARHQCPSVGGSGAGVALNLGIWCPATDAPSS